MTIRTPYRELFELPLAERLELVEDLWDSIAAESEALDIPAEVIDELRARQARFDADPASGLTWEQARQRMRGG